MPGPMLNIQQGTKQDMVLVLVVQRGRQTLDNKPSNELFNENI